MLTSVKKINVYDTMSFLFMFQLMCLYLIKYLNIVAQAMDKLRCWRIHSPLYLHILNLLLLLQNKVCKKLCCVYILNKFFSLCRMYGLFQSVFYFSYMALGSMGLGILCGKCNSGVC